MANAQLDYWEVSRQYCQHFDHFHLKIVHICHLHPVQHRQQIFGMLENMFHQNELILSQLNPDGDHHPHHKKSPSSVLFSFNSKLGDLEDDATILFLFCKSVASFFQLSFHLLLHQFCYFQYSSLATIKKRTWEELRYELNQTEFCIRELCSRMQDLISTANSKNQPFAKMVQIDSHYYLARILFEKYCFGYYYHTVFPNSKLDDFTLANSKDVEKYFQEICKEMEQALQFANKIQPLGFWTESKIVEKKVGILIYFVEILKTWSVERKERWDVLVQQAKEKSEACIQLITSIQQKETEDNFSSPKINWQDLEFFLYEKLGQLLLYWLKRAKEYQSIFNATSSHSSLSSSMKTMSTSSTSTLSSTISSSTTLMMNVDSISSYFEKTIRYKESQYQHVDTMSMFCWAVSLFLHACNLVPSATILPVPVYDPISYIYQTITNAHSYHCKAYYHLFLSQDQTNNNNNPLQQSMNSNTANSFLNRNAQLFKNQLVLDRMQSLTLHSSKSSKTSHKKGGSQSPSSTSSSSMDLKNYGLSNPIFEMKIDQYAEESFIQRETLLQKSVGILQTCIKESHTSGGSEDAFIFPTQHTCAYRLLLSDIFFELAALKSVETVLQTIQHGKEWLQSVQQNQQLHSLSSHEDMEQGFTNSIRELEWIIENTKEYNKWQSLAVREETNMRLGQAYLFWARSKQKANSMQEGWNKQEEATSGMEADDLFFKAEQSFQLVLQDHELVQSQQNVLIPIQHKQLLFNLCKEMRQQNEIFSGFLMKLGEVRKNWKIRFFVLQLQWLSYYEPISQQQQWKCLKQIPVSNIKQIKACRLPSVLQDVQTQYKKSSNSALGENSKTYFFPLEIETPKRTYIACATNEQLVQDWIHHVHYCQQFFVKQVPHQGKLFTSPTIDSPLSKSDRSIKSGSTANTMISAPRLDKKSEFLTQRYRSNSLDEEETVQNI